MKKCLISVGLALVLNPLASLAVAQVEDYSESATDTQEEGISFSRPSSVSASRSLPDRLRVLESKVDNLSQANLTARIEELQQTIAELRGQLEKQSHELEQLTTNQKSFYQDINSRLGQSSTAPAASASTADAAAPVAADVPPAKPAIENTSISARIKASSLGNVKTTSSANPEVADASDRPSVAKSSITDVPVAKASATVSKASDTPVTGEQGLYQQAFGLLKSKQYDRALTQFKEYVTKYPKGNYAVNAHFWMGEISYLQGKHSAAKKSFETVVKNYPKDKKIPDAMLKLAVIATDTGHKSQAEEMLAQIQKQYPGTTAARLAMIRAQELRLSTH